MMFPGLKKMLILLGHSFSLWCMCAAVMGIGMAFLPLGTALIIHAAAAPIIAFAVSLFYYRKFGYTKPLTTAATFFATVIFVDFFLVALIINGSLDMFRSFVGTWLPFILIFAVSYVTGLVWIKKNGRSDM